MKARWLLPLLLLVGCSAPQIVRETVVVEQTVVVKETVVVEQTVMVQVTQPPLPTYTPYPTYTLPVPTATHTPRPTNTPLPTSTPIPTETAAPTVAPSPTLEEAEGWPHEIGRNYVGKYEQSGLTIEVARAVFMTREAFEQLGNDLSSATGNWATAESFVEFVFTIQNQSGKTLSVYPDEATLLIGSRQIDIAWETTNLVNYDDVGGDIYNGVTKVGGYWAPAPRVKLEDIGKIVLRFDAALDESYNNVGGDWTFEIDMSGHPWEPWDASIGQ